MKEIFQRTKILIGENNLCKLHNSRVAVFGIGGVGSYVVEALVRSGIGNITIIDHDKVDVTNINRQIHALISTIGKPKVELMKTRIKDINPIAKVKAIPEYCTPENINELLYDNYDYIIDAIDTVTSKIAIIQYAFQNNIPVISSMGTANKLSNKNFQVVDISKTKVCPLAKIIRKELRKRGILKGVKVVYSPDLPVKQGKLRGEYLGSISYVPPVAGFIIAGEVINDLLNIN